jgi:hypothetical protein
MDPLPKATMMGQMPREAGTKRIWGNDKEKADLVYMTMGHWAQLDLPASKKLDPELSLRTSFGVGNKLAEQRNAVVFDVTARALPPFRAPG